MISKKRYEIIVVGRGLAGLTAALHLSQQGVDVLLLEKQSYPRHRVCGEYISKEVLPYLNGLGVYPMQAGAVEIDQLQVTTKEGKAIESKLPLGGFGFSRYAMDALLFEKVAKHISFVQQRVEAIQFEDDNFTVTTQDGTSFQSPFVVGAFGKRSNLDKTLQRDFIEKQAPWLAVKAHYRYDMPEDQVELHNFDGGYCGLSKVETGAVNACYLSTYRSFKRFAGIEDFQNRLMSQNPKLKQFFSEAEPLFEKPLTISQISFDQKPTVEDHVFMVGDSAGLIHPLCGNGMAMAIHAAKLFSEAFLDWRASGKKRLELENTYRQLWSAAFDNRLRTGRSIQRLLLSPRASAIGLTVARMFPSIVPSLIKKTHGDVLV